MICIHPVSVTQHNINPHHPLTPRMFLVSKQLCAYSCNIYASNTTVITILKGKVQRKKVMHILHNYLVHSTDQLCANLLSPHLSEIWPGELPGWSLHVSFSQGGDGGGGTDTALEPAQRALLSWVLVQGSSLGKTASKAGRGCYLQSY